MTGSTSPSFHNPIRRLSFERVALVLKSSLANLGTHAVLLTAVVICLGPLFWMVASSLKTPAEVSIGTQWLPSVPQFENYALAWTKGNFGAYFFNSIIYTLVSAFGVLAISSMAAYGFARLEIKGKNFFFGLFLATMLIPVPGAIVALYVLINKLGLIDTRLGYILPQINGQLALGIFILKPFFEKIPRDLEDAARIDGCGRFGIFWRVALPLVKPALAVVALFTSLAVWNEFILAQLVLQSQELMPLQLGLVKFWGGMMSLDHLLMAGMTISILPIVIAYVFLQRHIIAGVTAGAVKG